MAAALQASLYGSEVVPAHRSDHGDDIRVGDAVLVARCSGRGNLPSKKPLGSQGRPQTSVDDHSRRLKTSVG